ncbi:repressor LexA [Candidatus Uhrbacteria bacterium]|nr:repressor LexA [Candidatus Uhrbacteria bacterium]
MQKDPALYTKKIRSFYHKSRRMPSFAELADLFGFQSKNASAKLVKKLVETRILKQNNRGFLIPGPLLRGLKLLGTVEAGFPTPAEEELVDTLTLDDYLISRPDSTFLIKVSGESMIDAGIMPGDLVLMERGREPRTGDIVIAQVDQGWTMKYYEKQGCAIRLISGNKKYPPIIPKEELRVAGVVVSVVRKYV